MNDSKTCDRPKPEGYQPPQFDLKFLLLSIGMVAVWLAGLQIFNWGSQIVLAVIALTYLFGCSRTRLSVPLIAGALFLPYTWLFLIDYPWGDYRWFWIGMYLQLPGLIAEIWFHTQLGDTGRDALMTAFTCGLFLTGVTMARFGGWMRWSTTAAFAILSISTSALSYALFRA